MRIKFNSLFSYPTGTKNSLTVKLVLVLHIEKTELILNNEKTRVIKTKL